MKTLIVKKQAINISIVDNEEYISLTDIARYKNIENPKGVIQNWLRNRIFRDLGINTQPKF